MSDREALLAAVLDRPGDDTPRLVYADWLDDHASGPTTATCGECRGAGGRVNPTGGYVEFSGPYPKWERCFRCKGEKVVVAPDPMAARAEFIRVQVELARRYPGWSGVPAADSLAAGGSYAALKRRERHLFYAHHHEWPELLPGWGRGELDFWEIDPAPGHRRLVLRRGFPWAAQCSAADWQTHAPAVLAAHPVRAVTLTDRTHEAPGGVVFIPGMGGYGDKAGFEYRWPGITFTLQPPAPRTHQYSHWGGAAEGTWRLSIRRPFDASTRRDLPVEGRLRGVVPLGSALRPGDIIGPLYALADGGGTARVPRAIVTEVSAYVDGNVADVEARTVGEFTVTPDWHAPAPPASPFVTLEPRA
jgi:uncharacterized protein (TIGR02996 family)